MLRTKRKAITTVGSPAKKAKPLPNVTGTIVALEKSRSNERIRFKRCIDTAEELYHQVFKFMSRVHTAIKEHGIDSVRGPMETRYNVLLERLYQLEPLTWREQTRGPTSSRSWKASETTEDSKKHSALWILWTPPPERNIHDEELGKTLNEASGPYLTWGLPKRDGVISLDTDAFKKGVPVFVIEKFKVRNDDGKMKVQHRIKGLYFIFRKIKGHSTKMSLMTWEHVISGWLASEKVEKSASTPEWTKDE